MTDHGSNTPFERVVDTFVYAPIGMALFAKDVLPPLFHQLVARGKAEVDTVSERVSQQMGQARVLGQFAVTQGGDQIKREVSQRLGEARERGEDLARLAGVDVTGTRGGDDVPAPTRHSAPADEAKVGGSPQGNGQSGTLAGDASHLPIPDYDELSASQVVARLGGLDPDQLHAVAEYERARRQRKTILTKIAQLTA